MNLWALGLTLAGAAITTIGALWLLFGFSPKDPRFTDDGPLVPGRQTSQVVPNLLRAQGRVAWTVAVGAALQLAGAVLAVLVVLA